MTRSVHRETGEKPFFGQCPIELRRGTKRHPYALVLQCGSGSIAPSWLSLAAREWDLIANYYDRTYQHGLIGDSAFFQPGTKFSGMYNLGLYAPEVLDYDYIAVFDDDLVIGVEALSRLFQIGKENSLALYQPALTLDSYAAWPDLKVKPGCGLRRVNAVEIMMPVFSRAAWRLCLPHFARSLSGWGLDLLWGHLVSSQLKTDPVVVDEVQVRHVKEINIAEGAYYSFLRAHGVDARAELSEICAEWGLEESIHAV